MPRMKTESFGTDDLRWLGSEHGTHHARSGVLNPASFSTLIKDGFIPSGVPLSEVDGELVLYNAAANAGDFAGHLLTPQRVVNPTEKLNVPVMDHGRVLTSFLPVKGFTAPDSQPKSSIIYLTA